MLYQKQANSWSTLRNNVRTLISVSIMLFSNSSLWKKHPDILENYFINNVKAKKAQVRQEKRSYYASPTERQELLPMRLHSPERETSEISAGTQSKNWMEQPGWSWVSTFDHHLGDRQGYTIWIFHFGNVQHVLNVHFVQKTTNLTVALESVKHRRGFADVFRISYVIMQHGVFTELFQEIHRKKWILF